MVNKWLSQNGRDGILATYSILDANGLATPVLQNRRGMANPANSRLTNYHQKQPPAPEPQIPNDVLYLYERDWFSRIWVIQETVLAQNAVFLLEGQEISWDWVGLAAAIISTNFAAQSLRLTGYFTSESVLVGAANAHLMYRLSTSQSYLEPLKFSFCQLLQLTRGFECTDDRDRIYGLLGLSMTDGDSVATKIIANYRKERKYVYRDVARLILNSDSPLVLLSSAHLQKTSRPSLLPPLPSWIPRWHEHGTRTLRPLYPHPEFRCADGSRIASQIRISDSGQTLSVYGLVLDRIVVVEQISKLSFTDYIPRCRFQTPKWTPILSEIGKNKRALEGLAMTLTCGKDHTGYPVNSVDSHLADFAACLGSNKLNWGALGHTQQLTTSNTQQGAAETKLDGLLAPYMDSGNGNAKRYADAVNAALASHTMFRTESRLLGMGPAKLMEDGDVLCVLFGADVPFLLRQHEDGYLVIGECYVYDIMHGEVLDRLEEGGGEVGRKIEAEWLKLV